MGYRFHFFIVQIMAEDGRAFVVF
jgi:hypothetical protein